MKKEMITLSAAAVLSTAFTTSALADAYTVKNGDTLSHIARSQSTTAAKIKEWNRLTSDRIYPNQKLIVSQTNHSVAKKTVSIQTKQTQTYTVASGDSLLKIANRHAISLAELKEWNKLEGHLIYPGQKLIVAKSTKTSTVILPVKGNKPSNQNATKPDQVNTYIVKKGDSLWKVANLLGTTVPNLKSLNNLKSDSIYVGQTLKYSKNLSSTAPAKTPSENTNKISAPVTPAKQVSTVISEAKKQIGVPYSWAGSSPSGFDCSGFIYYVFKKAGYQISRVSSSTYFDLGKNVTNPQAGDLIFFSPSPDKKQIISHMGIYLGDGQFIHASSSKGVEMNSLSTNYYKTRLVGYKRL
ncbi:peptidoglycan endopeptidase [Bacillus sp. CECT 9360]|uniref:C40 family peptidase n=1 Tax=Bacillus sp. CECT 9360 TaxID=2845821 RepID=UPI001E293C3D|nr:peptidoglycan endopeptidase [Bacillus sp. CECT 9360]CAH0345140.1 D-gamma-glutamyl-meso-diaminopimelic acid endopeptidase CwlS [Bacillus sp. CECT 9360]